MTAQVTWWDGQIPSRQGVPFRSWSARPDLWGPGWDVWYMGPTRYLYLAYWGSPGQALETTYKVGDQSPGVAEAHLAARAVWVEPSGPGDITWTPVGEADQ